MKIIKRHIIITVVFLVCSMLTSCYRTELCYDHYPKAAVSFEWEQEWERDYGMAHLVNWDAAYHGFDYDYVRPETPEWVNFIKYKNNNPDSENYFSPEGGEIIFLEEADHSFLFYNGDTEYIVLSDMASLPDARASATPRSRGSISSILDRHPGSRSTNPPDVLYSAYIESIPTIKIHETLPMPVKMQPLVFTYVIRYEFEYGLEHVALARGALGGMADSVYLKDGRTSEESIIILYDCELKDYGCEAHVRSFGVPGFPDQYYGRSAEDAPGRPYTLNLEVMLTNGTTMQFNYDVADQIKTQPRGGVIKISGIRVEDEDNSTPMPPSGFDVDLSGWGDVDVDLPVESK